MINFICFALLTSAWARVEALLGTAPEQNANLAIALPETEASEILISRDAYVISYNKMRRAPNWVAWKLDTSQLGPVKRANTFRQDIELERYLVKTGEKFHAVIETEFSNSCFDRGHQVSSGDRTDTPAHNDATFVMSNMIAQTPYLNRVIWEHLEHYTRELVRRGKKTVYVVAGPIYDLNLGFIGPKKDIAVPSKDFKILYVLDENQTPHDIKATHPSLAVIMPNTLEDGTLPVANTSQCRGPDFVVENLDDWKPYQTTLAEIEMKSGLRFH